MATALGRFQLIEGNPPVMPNNCTICGSIEGKFIDFGLDIDFYGRVYFCYRCFSEAVNVLGLYTSEQWEQKTNLVYLLQESISTLTKDNNDLRKSMVVLSGLVSKSDPTLAISEELSKEREDTVKDSGRFEKREKRHSESNDEPRSTNIPRDDSLDEFIDF